MKIRYCQASVNAIASNNNQLSFKLAKHFQDAFAEFYSLAKPTDFQSATVLILDRSFDHLSPFLHDFSYQAIINDLLNIENGKKYRYTSSDGTEKLIYLDEEDQIYTSLKHLHLAQCSQRLVSDFNKFEAESKKVLGTDISKMQEAVANMNENLNKKEKFGIHLGMATECNKIFTSEKVDVCALMEQDMATGYDAEGDEMKPAAIFNEVVAMLSEPSIT
jgi:syntaxin-binding protein 1